MSHIQHDTVHWADLTAQKIIAQQGDKPLYTLASGITPSGTVHFGNFREVMTVDLVARGLKKLGKNVRFIFSWDDFDTFRKVPKNMPDQERLQTFLFQPIVDTPDTHGECQSYAEYNEKKFEAQLDRMGIRVEKLYQSKKYRAGDYREMIRKTLKERATIVEILSQYKTDPIPDSWWPVLSYCEKCNRDRISNVSYDGDNTVHYHCDSCGHDGAESISTSTRLKLPWRVDWPMRWSVEKVDFEPGGKDHSSEGGSFSTAKEIVTRVFGWKPPVYLQYDFVSVKGMGGKMSSSSGELVTVNDVLQVYTPEMIRWTFAGYKSNVDFSISFDLDVIKNYEDFDRMERLNFGLETGAEKKVLVAKRVYELSQVDETKIPTSCPFRPSFRHLCNVLQINDFDLKRAKDLYRSDLKTPLDERLFDERAQCAIQWIQHHAPDDFKFILNREMPTHVFEDDEKRFLKNLASVLKTEWDSFSTDKILHDRLYQVIEQSEIDGMKAFTCAYQLLISRPKGPKLAGFIKIIGKERALALLNGI